MPPLICHNIHTPHTLHRIPAHALFIYSHTSTLPPELLQMAQNFHADGKDMDKEFVRVEVAPLAGSVCDEALAWVRAVSGAMRELDIVALAGLQACISGWQAVLQQQPSTLDELKDVLQVVDTIRWVLHPHCI